ncbi:MAG: Magnesium transporter [Dehalococcoidales bacterium]|nr:Magnesium transporter [Dehalococcoidales bacterium]
MAISPEVKQEKLNIESVAWGDLTWIDIEPPTPREMAYLAKNYPFHPYDLDDCLSRKQRPKLDEYEDYLFFIFHFTIYNKETRVSTHDQVSVFLGEKYLITMHSGRLKPLVKLFHDCQVNEEARQDNLSHGSGFVLYRIIDRAVDAYFPILDKIIDLMEDVEEVVFDENVEAALEVASLRRNIITQRRIMFPVRTAVAELESKLKRFSKIDMSVYLGDLMDHMNKICETLDECKETIEVFKDADYVLGADRLNRIMRVLTIISTIMLPLIVISGLWSMNIPLPFGANPGGSPYFFGVMVVTLLSVVVAMLYFFHRKRWI